MQLDLQEPLKITRVMYRDKELEFERNGSVYTIQFGWTLGHGGSRGNRGLYEGVPIESTNPPWSGGLTWTEDELGKPFIATTCQGIGARHLVAQQRPRVRRANQGMTIQITVPEPLTAVSNGLLVKTENDPTNKRNVFHWKVENPINNYAVNMNIGNYMSMDDIFGARRASKDGVLGAGTPRGIGCVNSSSRGT